MRRHPEALLRARLAALYLLSLAAVYGSYLAWQPGLLFKPKTIAWPPLVLAAATFAGAAIHDRLGSLGDRHVRGRLRAVTGILYGGVLFLVCLGLLAGQPDSVELGGSMLRTLQPAFLLFAGFGRGHIGVLVNAFALTATSILAGGPGAAASVVLHGGLVAFFLVVDHAWRMLTEYPVDTMPPAGPTLGRGAVNGLLVGSALAAFFHFVPAVAYAPLQRAGLAAPLPPDRLVSLLGNLMFVGIVSGLSFYFLLRLGTGRGGATDGPVVEIVSARRRAELKSEALYTEPAEAMKGWRGRIVQLYVRTTLQLARWGRRRRPYQTPSEFARTLSPAGAAQELTDLFSRARYGPQDLTEADFQAASRAAQELLAHERG